MQELLSFTEEFPLICQQCLQDLKFSYSVYEKVKRANIQLINLYQDSLNQYIEEEHLVETMEGIEDNNNGENSNMIEAVIEYPIDDASDLTTKKPNPVTLDKNNSFIVTQFFPETLLKAKPFVTDESENTDEEFQPSQNLLTVNLKAVEVQNLENIERIKSPQPLTTDATGSAIFMCQYCPRAFSKPEYLKTHIQKSHVCKFCTQPFIATEDLFSHIRQVHTENRCAVCQKLFSSSTNLRHHMKRVHGIKLPAKVTLIDYIQTATYEEKQYISETELFDGIETPDIEYLWPSDNSTDISNENKITIN